MIEARNLFRIESKLKKGNKSIPVTSIEKDYVISWLLVGIAKSKLYDILCFKGGTALKKFYFRDYRFSEDLDFTLMTTTTEDAISEMLQSLYVSVANDSNIHLSPKDKETHANSVTFYINFSGPLGADPTKGEVKIDITMNERMIHEPIERLLMREYEEYQDIPDDVMLKVYTLEEIFVEKCVSVLDRSRNEPRDIHDLWYLTSNKCCEYDTLGRCVSEKGIYHHLTDFALLNMLDAKESNYQTLWQNRLDHHVVDLPPFEGVYRQLKRNLKALNDDLLRYRAS
ncbi:nucleotidyl transferase AbiEii/AbiGii toxin family protein [candidate division WOR-3 bacterium]|nr:nucleotidyl transferase AbiEii/AbiGii toxin family protein [candidate division WOR-3 bacterium]